MTFFLPRPSFKPIVVRLLVLPPIITLLFTGGRRSCFDDEFCGAKSLAEIEIDLFNLEAEYRIGSIVDVDVVTVLLEIMAGL